MRNVPLLWARESVYMSNYGSQEHRVCSENGEASERMENTCGQ